MQPFLTVIAINVIRNIEMMSLNSNATNGSGANATLGAFGFYPRSPGVAFRAGVDYTHLASI
ncbi:hypothetical protein GP2143_11202 [marine gamma proteobacterium HTCC2143]|uniref:Uncharacterized protein n=1 Tax=marine gamma proteobacterium HTCC2143 TaxID=247633 RepID=A0YGB0_9GAMM|nr:hypothetical protein GP2143_11202 [marine gamma proteobacterium HTCC2143]